MSNIKCVKKYEETAASTFSNPFLHFIIQMKYWVLFKVAHLIKLR